MVALGENLKSYRKERGMSQKQFGKLLGVGERTMSSYENNEREPSYETLIRIAEILNVSTDTLLGRKVTKQINVSSLCSRDVELVRLLSERLGGVSYEK